MTVVAATAESAESADSPVVEGAQADREAEVGERDRDRSGQDPVVDLGSRDREA